MTRPWIVALVSVVMAAPAAAQFTTFIAPPSPVKDSIKAAAVAMQHAVADSTTHAQITDMKTWVDSAAGIAVPVRASDTTLVKDTAAALHPLATSGRVAPQTASSLPFLLVIGGAAMLLGLVLIRRPALSPRRIDRGTH